jgi:anti-sigma regulatory factor (Ser/Thr protein kinase)
MAAPKILKTLCQILLVLTVLAALAVQSVLPVKAATIALGVNKVLPDISDARLIDPADRLPGSRPGRPWAGNGLPRKTELHVSARSAAPSLARRRTRIVLAAWGLANLAPTAELVVSELVTNAVAANSTLSVPASIRLRIEADPAGAALVMVTDASQDQPLLTHPDDDAPGGRGLQIVSALAAGWGFARHPGGKTVWAVLVP